MNYLRFYFLFFILSFLFSFSFAQNARIDSLQNVLKTAQHDTSRINTLNALSRELLNQGDYEKAMQYANDALQLATVILSKAKNLTIKQAAKKGMANAYNNIGLIYREQGNYDKALENHFASLKIREEIGNKSGMADAYQCIGLIHTEKGDYKEAIDFLLKSVKIREETRDNKMMAASYNNLGGIYYYQNDYTKAIEFYFKSLKIYEGFGDKKGIAMASNNIGSIYYSKNDFSQAIEFYFKALKIFEETKDKQGMAETLGNIGGIYFSKLNYSQAIEFYFKSLKIYEEIGDKQGMALTYNNIGNLYLKDNKAEEAKKQSLKSLAIAKAIGSKDDIKEAYLSLSLCDSVIGNFKSAYEYHQLYSQIKDTIFNEESQKQIAEMQTKYDTEKKEQQIKLLNKDKEIQAKDLERQKTIRNAVAGGLSLVLFFSFVLINRLLLIRKQKKVIEVEREKSEKLLLNILPKETADELKLNNSVKPKFYNQVTVMFTDFKGFTTIAEKMSAEELVSELDFIFKKFDEIISKYPIEKIKTIGDAYMCAGGLPVANTTNPMDLVNAALEIQDWMKSQNKWQLRLGIHTGSVIAGVVGDKKFAYDIWGDTVNTASRMESSGEPNKVNISGTTYNLIKDQLNTKHSKLNTIYRGKIPAKNKGEIEMYFVEKG